ncbi:MAG: sulfotransferase [Proteobacteria bacterium]|nr:MAG: sulfotransferase [Pseudomonadota bacterium]
MTRAAPRPIDWDDYFRSAEQLFRQGQFSLLWSSLQTVAERDVPQARLPSYYFYLLTCALYGVGDLDKARALNRRIDFRFHPTIRYRLCLRLGDFATARRLRRAHDYTESEQADFRYTLGLHCLSKGKYRPGFRFYQERHRAINTPKSLVAPLQYHYLTQDPADDPDLIVLEQGMGEVLISLLHIRAAGRHAQSTFCGMAKYRRLVARYFPQATYHSTLDASAFEGRHAILAVDFLQRAWLGRRSLAPGAVFDTPLRSRHDRPVFGICWRGGSAQNRREARHIPLPFFVQFLPREHEYLVLQYDVSDEERAFLRSHPNIQIPFLDLTADALATFDLVRALAGVISVAGANWHLAGGANIPLLAIMHDTPHWLWGRPADARSIYPGATTLDKGALSLPAVAAWSRPVLEAWHARDTTGPAPGTQASDRPVFVTGLPGIGLSRVMARLAQQGLWGAADAAQDGQAAIDAHENPRVRDRLIVNILKKLGAHEDCVVFPPVPERLPPFPWLRFQIEKALREQGWDGTAAWALADFRLAPLWPLFARAYPDATWVVVTQDADQVCLTLTDTPRFSRHSTSPDYWKMFLNVLGDRLASLCRSGERVLTVPDDPSADDIQTVMAGRPVGR